MFGWFRRLKPAQPPSTQQGTSATLITEDGYKILVSDADTVWVGEENFRLVGFDAPEVGRAKSEHEWRMGKAAAGRLQELLTTSGTVVRLERLPGTDVHNRGLAKLFINGRDIAAIAIEEGWGVEYAPADGRRRRSEEMPDWDSMKYPR